MNLHTNPEDFKQLIAVTSQHLNMTDVYVEKDYFVVLALKKLAESDQKKNGVFKGGTSLSKAYGIIQRFSEDIDLAAIKDDGTSRASPNGVKRLEKVLTEHESLTINEALTTRNDRLRKIVCDYPRLIQEENFGQASPRIAIDISRIMPGVPFQEQTITSYIHDYLLGSSGQQFIEEYDLHPIKVNTLRAERTFIEKVIAMANYSTLPMKEMQPIDRLKKGVRHIYDLHQLLSQDFIQDFCFNNAQVNYMSINELMNNVLDEDLNGTRNTEGYEDFINSDLSQCSLYGNSEEIWEEISPTYKGVFKQMLFGNAQLPSSDSILQTLNQLQRVCKNFNDWKVSQGIIYKNKNK